MSRQSLIIYLPIIHPSIHPSVHPSIHSSIYLKHIKCESCFVLPWTNTLTNGQCHVNDVTGNECSLFHTPLGDPELNKCYHLLKALKLIGSSLPSPTGPRLQFPINFPRAHLEA